VRTNRLLIGLALTLIWLNGVKGHPRFSDESNTRQEESSLQLTMKIVSSQYCPGDAELDSLRLKVRLIYTNTGKKPLILYKGIPLISRLMISRNLPDAAMKRFEINSSLTQLTGAANKCYKGANPNSCFFILPPSERYEAETVVRLFVVRGDIREISGAVRSGDHVLQVEVMTWNESDELAKNLRQRWRRYGILWYEPITSAPTAFIVEKQRKVTDCP